MATITRYVVSSTPEEWGDATYEYESYQEARDAAIEIGGCVTEIEYEFSDSALIDDFRETEDEEEDEDEEEA